MALTLLLEVEPIYGGRYGHQPCPQSIKIYWVSPTHDVDDLQSLILVPVELPEPRYGLPPKIDRFDEIREARRYL